MVACLFGAAGVGLLVLGPQASLDPVEIAAGLAGAASMTAGIVLAKRWERPPGVVVLTMTGRQLTAGGLVLAPAALLMEGLPDQVTPLNLAGFAYLSVVGALLAYALWFRGIERLPALAVSFLSFASPLTAAVLGFAALGETLPPCRGRAP